MLSEIIKLLQRNGPMSLADLATHFQMDAPAMEGILETLERKRRIERIVDGSKCATCKGCALVDPAQASIFKAL